MLQFRGFFVVIALVVICVEKSELIDVFCLSFKWGKILRFDKSYIPLESNLLISEVL